MIRDLVDINIVNKDSITYLYLDFELDDQVMNVPIDETNHMQTMRGWVASTQSIQTISPSVVEKKIELIKTTDLSTDHLISTLEEDILDKIVNSTYNIKDIKLDIDFITEDPLNLFTLCRKVISRIVMASNYIAVDTRRSAADYVIMNPSALENLIESFGGNTQPITNSDGQYSISGMRVITSDKLPTNKICVYKKSIKLFFNESSGKYGLCSDKDVLSLSINIKGFDF